MRFPADNAPYTIILSWEGDLLVTRFCHKDGDTIVVLRTRGQESNEIITRIKESERPNVESAH